MSSENNTSADALATASSPGSEEPQSEGHTSQDAPPFVSRRELRAQAPDIVIAGERYDRGEITHEEMMATIRSLINHQHTLRERERVFSERDRRGEVTLEERQKEYGLTDEEMKKISDGIDLKTNILSHNIARCRNRTLLYRNSRGH